MELPNLGNQNGTLSGLGFLVWEVRHRAQAWHPKSAEKNTSQMWRWKGGAVCAGMGGELWVPCSGKDPLFSPSTVTSVE